MESKHTLFKSFKFAFDGLKVAFVKGRNFRIQILSAVIAVIFGVFLKITIFEWLSLILIIAFVLILEILNTSLEHIVDMVSPEIREKAKIAKDMGASAVLIASIASVIMATLLFLPKIYPLLVNIMVK